MDITIDQNLYFQCAHIFFIYLGMSKLFLCMIIYSWRKLRWLKTMVWLKDHILYICSNTISNDKSVNFPFLQPDQVNNFGICDLKVFELYSWSWQSLKSDRVILAHHLLSISTQNNLEYVTKIIWPIVLI